MLLSSVSFCPLLVVSQRPWGRNLEDGGGGPHIGKEGERGEDVQFDI